MSNKYKPMQSSVSAIPFMSSFLVVLLIWILSLTFFKPQLEGWSVLLRFKESGFFDGLKSFYEGDSDRPLEHILTGIATLIFGPTVIGVQVVFASLMTASFIIFRVMINKVLGPNDNIIYSLCFIFLPFWFDSFKFESEALYFSSYLFIMLFLYSLKLHKNYFKFNYIIYISFGLFVTSLIYPGLLLVYPLIAAAHSTFGERSVRNRLQSAIYFFLPYLLYGSYFFINHKILGNSAYINSLLEGEVAATNPVEVLKTIYTTIYITQPLLFLTVSFFLIFTETNRKEKTLIDLKYFKFVLILPLFGLIYAQNFYFLSDLRRVTLPFTVAFIVLIFSRLLIIFQSNSRKIVISKYFTYSVIFFIVINCYSSAKPASIQNTIINKIVNVTDVNDSTLRVLVADSSGFLGDMFTFGTSDTLNQALKVNGVKYETDFCVNLSKFSNRPKYASVNAGIQVPLCQELDSSYDLKLNVTRNAKGAFELSIV
jgi:hypothetical protein